MGQHDWRCPFQHKRMTDGILPLSPEVAWNMSVSRQQRCKFFVIGWIGYTIGIQEDPSMPFGLVLYDELLSSLQADSHVCRSVPAGCLEGGCCQTAMLNNGWFRRVVPARRDPAGAIQQATIYQIWHYWGCNHAAVWLPLFPTSFSLPFS